MKCLANPERVLIVVMSAESKQKETNAAHQGFPGRNPTDLRNLVTQYPPLFPTSFVPTNPYAIFLTRSPSGCLTIGEAECSGNDISKQPNSVSNRIFCKYLTSLHLLN